VVRDCAHQEAQNFLRPKVSFNKLVTTREGTSAGLGLLVRPKNLVPLGPGGGCLDPSRKAANGSGSSVTQGTKKRTREPLLVPGSGNLTHAKSMPEGMRGELGLIAGLSAGEGLQAVYGDDGLRGGGGGGGGAPALQRRPSLR
jgi:hypothetical protein